MGELILRPVSPADAEPLSRLVELNRGHLRRWLPWLDASHTLEDTQEFIAASLRQAASREALQVVLISREQPVGVAGFHKFDWSNRSTSLGYWLAKEHEGRGFMTTACRALIDRALGEWNLNRIEIRCATGNLRSRAIPERLGFKLEGVLRSAEWLYDHFEDLVVYSLLADEFNRTGSGPVDPLTD